MNSRGGVAWMAARRRKALLARRLRQEITMRSKRIAQPRNRSGLTKTLYNLDGPRSFQRLVSTLFIDRLQAARSDTNAHKLF